MEQSKPDQECQIGRVRVLLVQVMGGWHKSDDGRDFMAITCIAVAGLFLTLPSFTPDCAFTARPAVAPFRPKSRSADCLSLQRADVVCMVFPFETGIGVIVRDKITAWHNMTVVMHTDPRNTHPSRDLREGSTPVRKKQTEQVHLRQSLIE